MLVLLYKFKIYTPYMVVILVDFFEIYTFSWIKTGRFEISWAKNVSCLSSNGLSVDVLSQTADFARTHGEIGVLKLKS